MSPDASLFDDITPPAGSALGDGPDWAGVRASLDSEGIALTPPLRVSRSARGSSSAMPARRGDQRLQPARSGGRRHLRRQRGVAPSGQLAA